MLRDRLATVRVQDGVRARVNSDTRTDNLISRQSLLTLGFRPMGTMACLALPGLPALGWWRRNAPHPPLAGLSRAGAR